MWSSDMKIVLDGSIYENMHISITKHKTKQSSWRIEHRFMGISQHRTKHVRTCNSTKATTRTQLRQIKKWERTQVFHMCHPSCYSCYKPCMFCWSLFILLSFLFWQLWCLFFFDLRILITPLNEKGPDFDYDKTNISVVICDTDTPQWLTNWWWPHSNCRSDDFNLTTRNPCFSNFLVSSKSLWRKSCNHNLWRNGTTNWIPYHWFLPIPAIY